MLCLIYSLIFVSAGIGGPSKELDILYGPHGDKNQLDLYLPAQRPFATIFLTYGGGWHGGSRKSMTPIAERFQKQGYACVILSHRLTPPDVFPAHIEDVATAFAWVHKNIAGKGGDPKRIMVMGHSSGAHLSLLLGADPQYLAKHGLKPSDIAGIVGLSTPTDLRPQPDKKGYGDVLLAGRGADAFSKNVEYLRQASPMVHLSKLLPPTMLVVGERDFPMLAGDAKAFAAQAKTLGLEVPVLISPKKDHMGNIRQLLEEPNEVTKQIMAFVEKCAK
jgi:acetyl esterase/lipase